MIVVKGYQSLHFSLHRFPSQNLERHGPVVDWGVFFCWFFSIWSTFFSAPSILTPQNKRFWGLYPCKKQVQPLRVFDHPPGWVHHVPFQCLGWSHNISMAKKGGNSEKSARFPPAVRRVGRTGCLEKNGKGKVSRKRFESVEVEGPPRKAAKTRKAVWGPVVWRKLRKTNIYTGWKLLAGVLFWTWTLSFLVQNQNLSSKSLKKKR